MCRAGLQRDAFRGVELALKGLTFSTPEGAQHLHHLVQALPALLERDTDCRVIPGGGALTHSDDEAATGEEVDGC